MTEIPISILNFDKDGNLKSDLAVLGPDITDVVVFSHGWHEDQNSALAHYNLTVVETLAAMK